MKTLHFNLLKKAAQIIGLLPLISRLILAIVGSYGVAVLSALACLTLPIDRISAVYWGYIVSTIVCTLMIIVVFSIRNLWRAWTVAVILAIILASIWQFGT